MLAEIGVWRYVGAGRSATGREDPSKMLSPLPLVGIVVALFAALALLAVPAGLHEESPDEALVAAFRAANEGDYGAADGYLSREAMEKLDGDTQAFWDAATEDRTVAEVSAQVEEQEEENARAQIFLQHEGGGSSGIVVPMIRRDGRWKILPQ